MMTCGTHLLLLPFEIRLQIYHYIVTPNVSPPKLASGVSAYSIDYHEYEKSSSTPLQGEAILKIRNTPLGHNMILRKRYKVRSGRLRSACQDASYGCQNTPMIHTGILSVNQQIHHEAAALLYSSYTFDFDTHIEACVPFISDLTPVARSSIHRVGLVKRALPYEKDFDRCEWSEMCEVLSSQVSLRELSLGIVAGKPAIGWDSTRRFTTVDFELLCRKDKMAWVNELAAIKGLQSVDVRACIEHCPPPESNAMAFFVMFSASLEPTFAEYLNGRLLVKSMHALNI